MPGIASAATAVVIGHIASGTPIRVGAGRIMLPNHAKTELSLQSIIGRMVSVRDPMPHPARFVPNKLRVAGTESHRSARHSIRFFDDFCSDLHFAKRMAFINCCGSFGAVLKTAEKCQRRWRKEWDSSRSPLSGWKEHLCCSPTSLSLMAKCTCRCTKSSRRTRRIENERSHQKSGAKAFGVLSQRGWWLESNSLKVLQLQLKRRSLAVFRLVSVMAHQTIDQAVLGFGGDKPILEAVSERVDGVFFCRTQSVFE